MNKNAVDFPAGYSYLATILRFLGGAVITALFSGSLAVLAHDIDPVEVLIVGMIVPSFTWVVQFSASMIGLSAAQRRLYWGGLGRVCLIGSVALLPAGFLNLCLPQPVVWFSALNVLMSVAVMGVILFRLCRREGIAWGCPTSWCFTICFNMGLFLWCSWHWY